MATTTSAAEAPRDGQSTQAARLSPALLVRGTAVSLGPTLLLELAGAASAAAVARGYLTPERTRSRWLPGPLVAVGATLPWLYYFVIRPWHLRWGATAEEQRLALPGDELVPDPLSQQTRAVTVDAPAEQVWQWLAQIGQGRGGFYSYDWLENLAGCDIHSADRIHPEWQAVKPGDPLPIVRGWGTKLAAVDPGRALVIDGWGTYAVRPLDAGSSRLIARARQPRSLAGLAYLLGLEIPHFVMERKMLLGLKQRAERAARGPGLLDQVLPRYDFGGSVSVTIKASPAEIFRAIRQVTLAEMPLAHALGTLRYLPGLLSGRQKRQPDERQRPFFELASPLVLAEQPGVELVCGSVGKLHDLLDQQVVSLDSPAAFREFAEPDYEKYVQSFRIVGGDSSSGYTLLAEQRTQALDATARWKFALYWYILVGWSGNWLLEMLLQAVKRRAERAAAGQPAVAPADEQRSPALAPNGSHASRPAEPS